MTTPYKALFLLSFPVIVLSSHHRLPFITPSFCHHYFFWWQNDDSL